MVAGAYFGGCVEGEERGGFWKKGKVFLQFFADGRAWFEGFWNEPRIDGRELERAKRRIVF